MKKKTIKKLTPREAVNFLHKKYVSTYGLAKAFGLKQGTVFRWVRDGKLPARRVMQGVKLSNYKITCHEFRPDIFPE